MASEQLVPESVACQQTYRWVYKWSDGWIEDQWRDDKLIFPLACFLSMAIEAFAQTVDPVQLWSNRAVVLRDITFGHYIILPHLLDKGDPYAFTISLVPRRETGAQDFEIRAEDDESTVYAKGVIGLSDDFSPSSLKKIAFDRAIPMAKREDDIYEQLRKVGLDYEKASASLFEVYRPRTKGARQALGMVRMPGEGKRYFNSDSLRVHHLILDSLLQIGAIAASGHALDRVETLLPAFIERLDVYHKRLVGQQPGQNLVVRAVAEVLGSGVFSTDAKLLSQRQEFQLIRLTGTRFFFTPTFAKEARATYNPALRFPMTRQSWFKHYKRHQTTLKQHVLRLVSLVELFTFDDPDMTILLLGKSPGEDYAAFRAVCDQAWGDPTFRRFRSLAVGRISEEDENLVFAVTTGSPVDSNVWDLIVFLSEDTREKELLSVVGYAKKAMLFCAQGLVKPECYHIVASEDDKWSIRWTSIDIKPAIHLAAPTVEKLSLPEIIVVESEQSIFGHDGLLPMLENEFGCNVRRICFSERVDQVLEETVPEGSIVISLIELTTPVLFDVGGNVLDVLKFLVKRSSALLWVTGMNSRNLEVPSYSIASGLLRALRYENPESKILSLGLEGTSASYFNTALNIVAILRRAFEGSRLDDVHYVQHMDSLFIPRFMPDPALNTSFASRLINQTFRPQNPESKSRKFDCATFSSDKSYVMVGCCGGLGRMICKFMAERGARNFLFLCHHKDERRKGKRWLKQILKEHGGTATYRVIESRERSKRIKAAKKTLEKILPQIDGAVFAPALRHDKPFENLSPENWQEVIESEAIFVDNLRVVLADMGIFAAGQGFLLMLNYTSTLFGVPGGGDLCALSAYRTSSARKFRIESQPAKTISIFLGIPVRKMTNVSRQPYFTWDEDDHEALYQDLDQQVPDQQETERGDPKDQDETAQESIQKQPLILAAEGSSDWHMHTRDLKVLREEEIFHVLDLAFIEEKTGITAFGPHEASVIESTIITGLEPTGVSEFLQGSRASCFPVESALNDARNRILRRYFASDEHKDISLQNSTDVSKEYVDSFIKDHDDHDFGKAISPLEWSKRNEFLERCFPDFSRVIDQTCEKLADYASKKQQGWLS